MQGFWIFEPSIENKPRTNGLFPCRATKIRSFVVLALTRYQVRANQTKSLFNTVDISRVFSSQNEDQSSKAIDFFMLSSSPLFSNISIYLLNNQHVG